MPHPPQDPDLLWHYTDADGLLGIAMSNVLRFSDFRYLNDRTERTYSSDVLRDVFREEVARGDADKVTSSLRDLLDDTSLATALFGCSFSGNIEESISQWQRYGADGSGYCVGFVTPILDDILRDDGATRVPIVYDLAEQKAVLAAGVRASAESYRTARAERPFGDELQEQFRALKLIERASVQVKNRVFSDEQEWRYYLTFDEPVENEYERFMRRGAYIKPFLELPRRRGRRLPIAVVICGPRLDHTLAVPSTLRFLRSRGNPDVVVKSSALASIWR